MPSLRNLLHPTRQKNGSSDSLLSPGSPKSPKSPRSPKSPSSEDLTRVKGNAYSLNQCVGCNRVEWFIRRNSERHVTKRDVIASVLLHHSYEELDRCAIHCDYCRVFRQTIILEEATFVEIASLKSKKGEIKVHWNEAVDAEGEVQDYLTVGIDGAASKLGAISCHAQNSVGHLALSADGLNEAVVKQARGWLKACIGRHRGECDNLSWSSEKPHILVQILSADRVRLCQQQRGDYVALSYCWGDENTYSELEDAEVKNGKTTTRNLQEREHPDGFPTSRLPKTVADAIRLVHAMEIEYFWADTLCITQDNMYGLNTMHKVYSNALFTLCACATTRATASLFSKRQAWSQPTEPCRLGGQFLTSTDMSLNELRLRSPLAERAWTLQEERLSPRMLYVSSSKMYWSCAKSHEMEVEPLYGKRTPVIPRPVYAPTDRHLEMPIAQEFLLACWRGTDDLYRFWADIVKSYAMRDIGELSDRMNALSGLAAKYLSASPGDEYLTGLWANNLAEGLAWRVTRPVTHKNEEVFDKTGKQIIWPSWSWAILPKQTAIETSPSHVNTTSFSRLPLQNDSPPRSGESIDETIRLGQATTQIRIKSRARPLWDPTSSQVDWSSVAISSSSSPEVKFSFSSLPEDSVHALDTSSGRLVMYEPHRRPLVAQIDSLVDVRRVADDDVDLHAVELGRGAALVVEQVGEEAWKRVGVAWDVREGYFGCAGEGVFVLE